MKVVRMVARQLGGTLTRRANGRARRCQHRHPISGFQATRRSLTVPASPADSPAGRVDDAGRGPSARRRRSARIRARAVPACPTASSISTAIRSARCPARAPRALREVVEQQWGDGADRSWNKHGWIDWPTRIAAKIAPIVGAQPNEVLVAEFDQRQPVQAARRRGPRAAGRKTILTQRRQFPDRPLCRAGPRRHARARGSNAVDAGRGRWPRSTTTPPSSS